MRVGESRGPNSGGLDRLGRIPCGMAVPYRGLQDKFGCA
jgi:hypothetical protein